MTRKSISFLTLSLLALGFGYQAHGDAPIALTPAQISVIRRTAIHETATISPPQVLYHWCNRSALTHMGNEYLSGERIFPLPNLSKNFPVLAKYPNLVGKPGLFAWSHPVAGMAANLESLYGDSEALVQFTLRPDARALLVVSETDAYEPLRSPHFNPDDYDVILHVEKLRYANGSVRANGLAEWIILNPNAIQEVNARREDLRPIIESWLSKVKDAGYKFPKADLHNQNAFYDADVRIAKFKDRGALSMQEALEKWLKLSASRDPKIFRQTIKLFPVEGAREKLRCGNLLKVQQ